MVPPSKRQLDVLNSDKGIYFDVDYLLFENIKSNVKYVPKLLEQLEDGKFEIQEKAALDLISLLENEIVKNALINLIDVKIDLKRKNTGKSYRSL